MESERLERHYASKTLPGLIASGYRLLRARRVQPHDERQARFYPQEIINFVLYVALVAIPAVILSTFQTIRHIFTGEPKQHPEGAWQWALHFSLREDLAHHTVETIGYHHDRPQEATETDDLAAWVMTLVEFLWGYEELMGVVWDEWTLVRLVNEAADEAGLGGDDLFRRLPRQWEIARPYYAPFNGTYADVRRGAFDAFITPRMEALPDSLREQVRTQYADLRSQRREYQQQMSLLYRVASGSFRDDKAPIPLWDAHIGLILNGKYFLIPVAIHDDEGFPVAFGPDGRQWRLDIRDGVPYAPNGDALRLVEDRLIRQRDGKEVGYLDRAPFSAIKWQLDQILNNTPEQQSEYDEVDIFLAETPRRHQKRLRRLLSSRTQEELERLTLAPILINWDVGKAAAETTLAELRRVQRGVGDHALTVIRTDESFLFDHHHIFFDGVWSLAMAEVLTKLAVGWCERGLSIPTRRGTPYIALDLHASASFLRDARSLQGLPEISAETTIHDIMTILGLRKRIAKHGAGLTVNDLLVTTRIFHAVNYKPSTRAQVAIDKFRESVRTPAERRALRVLQSSLRRGREISPALGIPVDASPSDPAQRIYLLTFRNTIEQVVWAWGDAWDAYQAYRRIEPPDTPEGLSAYRLFDQRRDDLITVLRDFSYLLAASKAVAIRGDSFSVAVFNLLAHLPPRLQNSLRLIPEQFNALNEIIRGDEVYSNVGRVASGSSLSRFITAKDDGNAKAIVWGIMTDDNNNMVITMRDFRPHVDPLVRVGRVELAQLLAQDYVDAYTNDLLGLVARMTAMLLVQPPMPDPAAENQKAPTL